jgi:hypothetical protein
MTLSNLSSLGSLKPLSRLVADPTPAPALSLLDALRVPVAASVSSRSKGMEAARSSQNQPVRYSFAILLRLRMSLLVLFSTMATLNVMIRSSMNIKSVIRSKVHQPEA